MKSIISILLFFAISNYSWQPLKDGSAAASPIILIMDGSGSMWGQINGETKIAIARQVVGDLVDNLDENRPLGLVVYGHREKGDCQDIETMAIPETGNREKIKSILKNINPVGKTPLANTALMVIEQIKQSNSAATVILISDGAESCGGDLCAVIKAAKEAGIDFVLHIVGFDIGESDKLALECAAQAGEGLYMDASDASELGQALEQATELTVDEANATLSVKVTKNGKPHDTAVKIYKPGQNDFYVSKRTYKGAKSNPAIFRIPAGTYHIEAAPMGTNAEPIWRKEVLVSGDDIKTVEIDFTAGKFSILSTGNNKLWDCTVHITKPNETRSIAQGRTYKSASWNPMIKELSPGTYDIKIKPLRINGKNIEKVFKGIDIIPGETVEVSHNFDYGTLSIMTKNNDQPWDCTVHTHNSDDAKRRSVGSGRTYKSSRSNPWTENFVPGNYNVLIKPLKIYGGDLSVTISDIKITAGQTATHTHDYEAGTLRLGATYNGQPWKSKVTINLNGKNVFSTNALSATTAKNPIDLQLLPAEYEVIIKPLKLDAEQIKLYVSIKSGQVTDKSVIFK